MSPGRRAFWHCLGATIAADFPSVLFIPTKCSICHREVATEKATTRVAPTTCSLAIRHLARLLEVLDDFLQRVKEVDRAVNFFTVD